MAIPRIDHRRDLSTSILCLAHALVRGQLTRDPRSVGLAFYMMSCLGVAWVVGMGRYAWGDTVLDSRYAAASVVAVTGAYFVWELLGPPRLVPLVRMLFFTTAAGFMAANLQLAVRQGVTLRDAERAYLRDLQAAKSIPQLVARHSWVTYYYHDRLAGYLKMLRDAGITPYDRLPASDPAFTVRTVPAQPTTVHEIEWDGGGGQIVGPDAYLGFNLDKPEWVSGLRFRFALTDPSGMSPAMKVRWHSDTKNALEQSNCRYEFTSGEAVEIVIYIDDKISQFMIFPNNRSSSFRISEIELLLPETTQSDSLQKD